MPERPKSDYRECFGDIKPFPDLIPVVGLFTYLTRKARMPAPISREVSRSKLAKEILLEVVTIGTYRWPQPVDLRTYLRSQMLAARNVGFALYHSTPLFAPVVYTLATG